MRPLYWEIGILLTLLISLPDGLPADDDPPPSRYRRLEGQIRTLRGIQEERILPALEAQDKQFAALTSRIDQLERRVRAVEAQAQADRKGPPDPSETTGIREQIVSQQQQLRRLEARIQRLEKTPERHGDAPSAIRLPPDNSSSMSRPSLFPSTTLRAKSTGPAGYLLR